MIHTSFNSGRLARQVSIVCASIAALALVSGCTTTTRMGQPQPVSLNSNPSSMSELHIANVALDSGDISMATTIYERLARAHPQSIDALTGLGNTLYAVGDFTRAGVYFERASKVDPTAAGPQIGMARVAIHQRRLDAAIEIYRTLLAKTPGDALAATGLGAALDIAGQHGEAQRVLRDALAKNPGDPLLSVNLGLSLVMSGDPQQGANVLLDVTRYPAAPPQARQDLALAFGLLGNADAASQILAADLPKDQVADNLRYYAAQRALMFPGKAQAAPTTLGASDQANTIAAATTSATALPVASAIPMISTLATASSREQRSDVNRTMAVSPARTVSDEAVATSRATMGMPSLTTQTMLIQ